jgi:tetratricopeptide (TPR) repeat protein
MKKTTTKTLVPKAFKMLQEGMNYHHQGNLTQAKSSYLRVLQLYPDQPDALNLLGVLALSNGRADKALELIDKAISTNPGVAEYHLNKGIALKAQDEPGESGRARGGNHRRHWCFSRRLQFFRGQARRLYASRPRGRFDGNDGALADCDHGCRRATFERPGPSQPRPSV